MNGPYRVLLADKIWRIGETLDLNPMIAVTVVMVAASGNSISPDGGRLALQRTPLRSQSKSYLKQRQLSNTSASLVNLDKIVRDATGDVTAST